MDVKTAESPNVITKTILHPWNDGKLISVVNRFLRSLYIPTISAGSIVNSLQQKHFFPLNVCTAGVDSQTSPTLAGPFFSIN